MSKKCNHCGGEIVDDAEFCSFCGASVQFWPQPQQLWQAPSFEQKPKASRFIFVTSLVYLILFGLNCLNAVFSVGDVQDMVGEAKDMYYRNGNIAQNYLDAVYLLIAVMFITFFVIITLFVVAKKTRTACLSGSPAAQKLASAQTIFSIMTLVFALLCLVVQINIYSKANAFIKEYKDNFEKNPESSIKKENFQSVVFILVFAGLSIVCLFKSISFKKQIGKK